MTHADFELRLPIGDSQDELAELGRAFNLLLDQLQTAFDRQRRFTGDVAHQLRNPLTVLQGQLEVARRRRRSTEDYEKTLDVLITQTAELRQVVESLLFLARAEEDWELTCGDVIALDEWLPHYTARFEGHLRQSDLIVRCEPRTFIAASVSLLTQLLDNLLSNAFKYSEPETPVELRVERTNHGVTLTVQDHGIGISPSDRPIVFEAFFRSDEVRRGGYPGTGLGLSVVARIAAVLNAEIQCESTPGQGSRFTLSFPAVPALDPVADEQSASVPAV